MERENGLRDSAVGIYLRPMSDGDTDQIVNWRNSEEIRRNFIQRDVFTPEGHRDWVRRMIDTGKAVQMMICEADTGRPVGAVNIQNIDRQHHKAEYGIFIGEASARGRGIGTAAAKLMLRYCFETQGLNRVYLRALAENRQAVRSYEKAGFVQEGLLREDVCIDGRYHDIVWMAALKDKEKAAEAADGENI